MDGGKLLKYRRSGGGLFSGRVWGSLALGNVSMDGGIVSIGGGGYGSRSGRERRVVCDGRESLWRVLRVRGKRFGTPWLLTEPVPNGTNNFRRDY
jgi:hypothetical protein